MDAAEENDLDGELFEFVAEDGLHFYGNREVWYADSGHAMIHAD